MKKIISIYIVAILATIIIPLFITLVSGNIGSNTNVSANEYTEQLTPETKIETGPETNADIIIQTDSTNTITFEEYIKGVVAAEMPISFEIEALKAQAVAARTYALKKLAANQAIQADLNKITPSQMQGQAYIDNYNLYTKWGENYNQYYSKLCEAVNGTKGEVLVYQDELIDAVFHSTSAGMTENSENVWMQALPYLVSVESMEDKAAPDFLFEKPFYYEEVIERLKTVNANIILQPNDLSDNMQVIERSEAGYIKLIQIGNIVFTGNEVRVALELRSNNFEYRHESGKIIFTTKGYGHGVGMSQYGANFLAKDGGTYTQILEHYYNGTQLSNVDSILSK